MELQEQVAFTVPYPRIPKKRWQAPLMQCVVLLDGAVFARFSESSSFLDPLYSHTGKMSGFEP